MISFNLLFYLKVVLYSEQELLLLVIINTITLLQKNWPSQPSPIMNNCNIVVLHGDGLKRWIKAEWIIFQYSKFCHCIPFTDLELTLGKGFKWVSNIHADWHLARVHFEGTDLVLEIWGLCDVKILLSLYVKSLSKVCFFLCISCLNSPAGSKISVLLFSKTQRTALSQLAELAGCLPLSAAVAMWSWGKKQSWILFN